MADPSPDPLDRLAALGDGDPLPLAPADAVRARGEQRRRHGRTALGAAGAAVLLAAGAALGLGVADRTPDSLGPAAPGPSSPAASPSPPATSEPASEEDELLTPQDAAAARPGTWTVGELRDRPGDPSPLDPCGGTAYPLDAKRVHVADRALVHADGQRLLQQVARYDTEASAAAAVQGYRRAVEGCYSRDLAEPAATPPSRRFHQLAAEPGRSRFGDDALFVKAYTGCSAEQHCDSEPARYSVVRDGAWVVVLELAATERDAESLAVAEQLAQTTHRALQRVACEVGACTAEPYAPSPLPRTAELTHGGFVWAVYLAVSEQAGAPELAEAGARAEAAGYLGTLASPYDCDVGAKEGLGYSDETELHVSLLYFDSAATAERFVDAYDGPVVRTVRVQTLCMD